MGENDDIKDAPSNEKRNPWLWVPSVYVAEGIPYMIVMAVSVAL